MDAPYQYAYCLSFEARKLKESLEARREKLLKGLRGMAHLGRDGSFCSFCSKWELELEEVNNKLNKIDDEPEYWEAH